MFSFLKRLFSTRVLSLAAPDVLLIFSCYILAAYWASGADPWVFLFFDNGLVQIALVAAGVLAGLQLNKLYVQVGVRSKILLVQQLSLTMGVTFLLEALLSYTRNPELVLAPPVMLLGSGLALAALAVWRMFYSAVLWKNFAAKRVLFYGTEAALRETSHSLAARPEMGLSTVGYIDDTLEAGTLVNGARVLGAAADLERVVAEVRPDRIVVGVAERRRGLPFQKLLDLQFHGMEIQRAGELYELICERVCVAELLPSQLVFSSELGARRGAVALQAIYSNLAALAGLAVLGVWLPPLAIAIKLSSPGPVMEAQPRLGLNMVPFTLRRFRCRAADGRLTRVGRWLRRAHLDALPELLNVIRGEMALVGPRPHRPEFIPVLMEQIPYYGERHAVRPGIMGWSQLNRGYGGTRDEREALEYDLYYIKHVSPALDAYIVLHSLMEAPFGGG
jgi:lipopolysaccharide/colanic/teichoic acid biosynthesis glycosyltransferase